MTTVLITPTPTVEGWRITKHFGLVAAEAIVGANILRDLAATITDVIGGRSTAYESALSEARNEAMAELRQRAVATGANAVISVDVDYETVGSGMLMVCLSGAAVCMEPLTESAPGIVAQRTTGKTTERLPEPTQCLSCGATIPAWETKCSECGWTYEMAQAV